MSNKITRNINGTDTVITLSEDELISLAIDAKIAWAKQKVKEMTRVRDNDFCNKVARFFAFRSDMTETAECLLEDSIYDWILYFMEKKHPKTTESKRDEIATRFCNGFYHDEDDAFSVIDRASREIRAI